MENLFWGVKKKDFRFHRGLKSKNSLQLRCFPFNGMKRRKKPNFKIMLLLFYTFKSNRLVGIFSSTSIFFINNFLCHWIYAAFAFLIFCNWIVSWWSENWKKENKRLGDDFDRRDWPEFFATQKNWSKNLFLRWFINLREQNNKKNLFHQSTSIVLLIFFHHQPQLNTRNVIHLFTNQPPLHKVHNISPINNLQLNLFPFNDCLVFTWTGCDFFVRSFFLHLQREI